MKLNSLFSRTNNRKLQEKELKEWEVVYAEVLKAHKEWERAHLAFQSALGTDEVDVAIYTLEAAERRYQIQLKAAKKLEIHLGQQAFKHKQINAPVRRLGS
jgi:hypothetical protein